MKPEIEEELKQIVQTLTPKQQMLDFNNSNLWRQLPDTDRRACRDAVAALLRQVTLATQENHEHE